MNDQQPSIGEWCSGGATIWCMSAKSADVETLEETTALGAADAAGLAVGYWKAVEDLHVNWCKEHEWTLQMPAKHCTPVGRRL